LTNSIYVDIKSCINPIVPIFTHHIINYLPILEYNIRITGAKLYFYFFNISISIVKHLGDNIHFIDYFTNNNLKVCLELFYGQVNYIIDDNLISIMQKHEFKFLIWINKELKCLIKQKKLAHDKYKHSNDIAGRLRIQSFCEGRNKLYLNYIAVHWKYVSNFKFLYFQKNRPNFRLVAKRTV